jgi:hypothetical protein
MTETRWTIIVCAGCGSRVRHAPDCTAGGLTRVPVMAVAEHRTLRDAAQTLIEQVDQDDLGFLDFEPLRAALPAEVMA